MKLLILLLSLVGLLLQIIYPFIVESIGFFSTKTLGLLGIFWILLSIDIFRNKLGRAKNYVYILAFIKLLSPVLMLRNFGDTKFLDLLVFTEIQFFFGVNGLQILICILIYVLIRKIEGNSANALTT